MIQNLVLNKKYDDLIMVGDLHWRILTFLEKIKKYDIKNTLFYHVGDLSMCDWNIATGELSILNRELYNRNCYFLSIRGNHDDCWYFNKKFELSAIKLLPDFTITEIIIKDKVLRIMGIGGAVSIDRAKQKENGTYFLGEEFPYLDNYDFLHHDFNLDILVTHTCPAGCWPIMKSPEDVQEYSKTDTTLYAELYTERYRVKEVVDKILEYNPKITSYYYGHFHFSHQSSYLERNVRLLNKEELLFHP